MKNLKLIISLGIIALVAGSLYFTQLEPEPEQLSYDYTEQAGINCLTIKNATIKNAELGGTYCPNTVTDIEGNEYNTVLIGTQCWMAENLNVGTTILDSDTLPSNDSIIEKWCNGADGGPHTTNGNCVTYGGLYTWAEAMGLSTSCVTASCCSNTDCSPNQGICPAGWHIPTDDEYKILEVFLGMCEGEGDGSPWCVDKDNQWRGTDQGTQLKSSGTSGFEALLAGYRSTGGAFNDRGTYTHFWSSTESAATTAWIRYLHYDYAQVFRYANSKAYGFSVRCLKD